MKLRAACVLVLAMSMLSLTGIQPAGAMPASHPALSTPDLAFDDGAGLVLSGDGSWIFRAYDQFDGLGGVETFIGGYNWRTGESRTLPAPTDLYGQLYGRAASHDGSHVVWGTPAGVAVWNTLTDEVTTLANTPYDLSPTISPDGRYVRTNSWTNEALIDLTTGQAVNSYIPGSYGWFVGDQMLSIVYSGSTPNMFLGAPGSSSVPVSYAEMCATVTVCDLDLLGEYYPEHYADLTDFLMTGYRFMTSRMSIDRDVMLTIQEDGVPEIIQLVAPTKAGAKSLVELVYASDYTAGDAEIVRMYQAFFNRQPDLAGVKYWLGVRADGHGRLDIAGWMAGGAEFKNLYSGSSNADYVSRVYANVLGRGYDQAGYDYWLGFIDAGELSRSGMVFYVTQNAEFIQNYRYLPAAA